MPLNQPPRRRERRRTVDINRKVASDRCGGSERPVEWTPNSTSMHTVSSGSLSLTESKSSVRRLVRRARSWKGSLEVEHAGNVVPVLPALDPVVGRRLRSLGRESGDLNRDGLGREGRRTPAVRRLRLVSVPGDGPRPSWVAHSPDEPVAGMKFSERLRRRYSRGAIARGLSNSRPAPPASTPGFEASPGASPGCW